MRLIFITLVTLIASLYAGEPNQRVTQIMQVLGNSVNNATQTKEAAIAAAEARHQQEVSRANGIAIQGLKRLITSRSTPIEQVEIYRIILSVNREDEDAVRFFTAIGTLDNVLASLDTVTDMFGNEVKKEEALPIVNLKIGQSIVLNTENVSETTATPTNNNSVGGRKVFEAWRSDRSATWRFKLQPGVYEVLMTYGHENEAKDSFVTINAINSDSTIQHELPFTGHYNNWRTIKAGELSLNNETDGINITGTSSSWVMHLDNITLRRIR